MYFTAFKAIRKHQIPFSIWWPAIRAMLKRDGFSLMMWVLLSWAILPLIIIDILKALLETIMDVLLPLWNKLAEPLLYRPQSRLDRKADTAQRSVTVWIQLKKDEKNVRN
jgi:hypothetical protein